METVQTMHIGFSGTRNGMNEYQKKLLTEILTRLSAKGDAKIVLHHGDCIGADEEAHYIAKELGIEIHIHPPKERKYRAFLSGAALYPEKSYLTRNHDIVNSTQRLYAAPSQDYEILRSGTWATIRYAYKVGKPVFLIRPVDYS